MDIASIINSPLLSLVGVLVPQAAPVIAVVQRFAPTIIAAAPVIQAAIKEGAPAFAAPGIETGPSYQSGPPSFALQVESRMR